MKEIIFVAGLVITVPVGAVLASIFPRIREALFFVLVAGTTVMHRADINFMSREMYRGSTRGIEFSFLDFLSLALLLSCVLSPPPAQKRSVWPASLGFLLAYVGYCGLSVLMSEPKIFPVFEFTKVLRGLVIFLAVAMYVSKPRDIVVFVLGLCSSSVYVTSLSLVERYLWGINRVPGPFEHSNEFSQYCCIMAPVLAAVALSDRHALIRTLCAFCVAGLGVCVMMTICRAGFATFCLVTVSTLLICSGLAVTPKKLAMALVITVAAAGMVYKGWDTLMTRFGGTNLEAEYLDSDYEGRGLYLRIASLVVQDHFFGVGLNNWSYVVNEEYYPRMGLPSVSYGGTDIDISSFNENDYVNKIAPPAHNLGALTIAELGVPGFIIFYVMWGRWFQMGLSFFRQRTTRVVSRFGVGAFFAVLASFLHCLTEYGFRHPHIFFLMHILVGVLASAYMMRDTDSVLSSLLRSHVEDLRRNRMTEAPR